MLRIRPLFAELRSRWRALFHREQQAEQLDQEIALHIELETEELIRQGVEPREARRRARAAFGSRPATQEECREEWGLAWIEDSVRDLRLGLRSLRRSPSFTLAALANLSLGIAATLIVYSVVEAVVLAELPYHEPDRVVRFFELTPEGDRFSISDQDLLDYRERSNTLAEIAAIPFPDPALLLRLGDVERRVQARAVTSNYFRTFGVEPASGRFWDDSEVQYGSLPRQVVLSHELWGTLFPDQGLDQQTVQLGEDSWQVIGVLPTEFSFGSSFDVYLPHALNPEHPRGDRRLAGLARLAPGATLEAANAEVQEIAARLESEFPRTNEGYGAELELVRDWLVGDDARRSTNALTAAVLLLLLLTCASVAGLLSARASYRRSEFELRRALGAGRGRLLRQLLLEALALGVIGAATGTALAAGLIPLIRTRVMGALPRIEDMALAPSTVLLAAAAALFTSLLFGTLPALRASAAANQSRARGDVSLRSALVVGQLAIALVLTAGAATLLTSLDRLHATDIGFAAEGLYAAQVELPEGRYAENTREVVQFYREVRERLSALPGIESASASTLRPFVGFDLRNTVGLPTTEEKSDFEPVMWRSVMPGTFRTLGIPLLRGRDFRDTEQSLTTILSQSLAQRLFGDRDPIGEQVRWISPRGPLATVVGVVADVRDLYLQEDPHPTYYWPQGSMGWPHLSLLLRTNLEEDAFREQLYAALKAVDGTLPPPEIHRTTEDLGDAVANPRLNGVTFLSFAALALLTAVVGLYGLIAYSVSTRRAEIAVRMSLGAAPRRIGVQYVGQALRMLLIATALAALMLFAASRVLNSLLYETSTFEPFALGVTGLLFLTTASLASLLPALRTARRPLVDALREE